MKTKNKAKNNSNIKTTKGRSIKKDTKPNTNTKPNTHTYTYTYTHIYIYTHTHIYIRAVTIRDMKPKSRHSDPRSCVIRENRDTPRDYLSNHVTPACKSWASCTQISPSRTSRACSLPKQKTQRLCVSSQITRTRIHTLIERISSARHDNKGKLYSYQNARFFKQTSQWRRRRGWCILPAVLILWSRR